MFLDKYSDDKESKKFISDIQKKEDNIQTERIEIGKIIEKQVSFGKSKKEILEMVIDNTSMGRNNINNMIEEFIFNHKYNTKLNIQVINILKVYFKSENIPEINKADILADEAKLDEIIETVSTLKKENKKYNHSFSLDEEGELLFQESKKIMEKKIDRKISNKSEFLYLLLLEFFYNNEEEF
jgi:hypothetical protein